MVGTEKDIINFLFETDKNENLLIFSGPFEFGKENKKIKLRFGAEIKIEDKNEDNKIEIYERLSPLISESENEIKLLEYKMIGEEKGIFYIGRGNKEIKRYYLKKNDFVNFNKNKYKVELSKNRLMFINLDKGEKIIFYLGDDGEKNNNKD